MLQIPPDIIELNQFDTATESTNLQILNSELVDNEIQYEFTESNGAGEISAYTEAAASTTSTTSTRTANKYMWNYNTGAYNFASQTWSTNEEVYSTYTKNSDGFVNAGYLLNPRGPVDYSAALREGYLNDSAYDLYQGHYYQDVVSSEDYNDLTVMLESNADVYIFDNDLNLIYRSTDEAGITSYFTRYYSTQKTIAGSSNRVISLGLVVGNYYLVFSTSDDTATSGFHYGFYAGQPLPIAQSSTFSDLTHYTTIYWDRISLSQSATTQTLTLTCPTGTASEYALTKVTFSDLSKPFANNTYASSIDYYYTPATASYSTKLTQTGGWWADLVDTTPTSGSIQGSYGTQVTVHWVSGIAYVNASCTTMTQMTIQYLVPFGILAG